MTDAPRVRVTAICFALLLIPGCSRSPTPNKVKSDFKTNLFGSSTKWSMIEWQAFDEPTKGYFDVRATHTVDGKVIYFHCYTDGSRDAINITASSKPAAPGYAGRMMKGTYLARWTFRKGTELDVPSEQDDIAVTLSRDAEEVATALYKSLP